MEYKNPFKFETPVHPTEFIGRRALLQTLSDEMAELQNISLYGERRTGKTSLLEYIAHPDSAFKLPENHIPIYFNFDGTEDKNASFIWQEIAYAIAKQIRQRLPDMISETSAEHIESNFVRAFSQLDSAGYKFHLLFDDFEQTAQNSDLRDLFYDTLFNLPVRAGNISYVLATHTEWSELRKRYNRIHSSFLNKFMIKSLVLFEEEDVIFLLNKHFMGHENDNFLYETLCGEISFLHRVSGYHPFFLQMICHHLCSELNKNGGWVEKAKKAALQAFKKDSEQYFKYYWDVSSKAEQKMIQKLAIGKPADPNKSEGVFTKLKDRCLLVLTDENENGLRLFSPEFRNWVNKNQNMNEEIRYIGKNYYEIKITQDTALFVDKETGEILGPQGEGMLAAVLYAGVPESRNSETSRLETERAVRIPRLLQSDMLLNYHIAEISFYEGKQANRYTGDNYLLSATFFHNLTDQVFTRMPSDSIRKPCYVGFYLSPGSSYKICLLSEENAWPDIFEKYVDKKHGGAHKLFSDIKQSLKDFSPNEINTPVFLPYSEDYAESTQNGESDKIAGDGNKKKCQLKLPGRDNLSRIYAGKEANGWWFNLPVTGYPWMSADLQRLLTGYLDEEDNKSGFKGLDEWEIDSWLELVQKLTQGLIYLHQRGGVHGDIRPANIMTNVYEDRELSPDQFKWIDVGLASDEFAEFSDNAEASIPPRPLGDERKTPFYAPERNEILEFEDADKIKIEKNEQGIFLSFLWRKRTFDDAAFPLKIKENGSPIRELGKLRQGDRIQVREFLFDIEKVGEADVQIRNVCEIAFGQLLIQRTGKYLEKLIKTLNNASISRYKIYKQWGQAADIYGFGVIILYLFYMRGLYNFKRSKNAGNQEGDTDLDGLVFNRLRRERTFEEFILLLKNQSFLEIFLYELFKSGIETTEKIWELGQEGPETEEKLSAIADIVIGLDATSVLILHGTDGSYRLFTQIIYLVLCCLWRQDEVDEIMQATGRLESPEKTDSSETESSCVQSESKTELAVEEEQPEPDVVQLTSDMEFPLEENRAESGRPDHQSGDVKYHQFMPFCKDRFKIRNSQEETPAKHLKKAIDQVVEQKYKNAVNPVAQKNGSSEIGATWQKRITSLKQTAVSFESENKRLKTDVDSLSSKNNRLKSEFRKLSDENAKLKKHVAKLTDKGKALKRRSDKLSVENTGLKLDADQSAKESTSLARNIEKFIEENLNLTQNLETLTEENSNLKQQLATANSSLKERAEELILSNAGISKSSIRLTDDNVDLKRDMERLVEENSDLKQEMEQLTEENSTLKTFERKMTDFIDTITDKCYAIKESGNPFPTALRGYKKGYVDRFFKNFIEFLNESKITL